MSRFNLSVGTIIFILIGVLFKPVTLNIECTSLKCTVTEKSVVDLQVGRKTIDISEIENFYISKVYLNRKSRRTPCKTNNHYYVVSAKYKSGKTFEFISKESMCYINVQTAVRELNRALDDPSANIKIKYK